MAIGKIYTHKKIKLFGTGFCTTLPLLLTDKDVKKILLSYRKKGIIPYTIIIQGQRPVSTTTDCDLVGVSRGEGRGLWYPKYLILPEDSIPNTQN
jgi:hypothetical protein